MLRFRIDNHYIIEAKTPETEGHLVIQLEGTADMIKDDRVRSKNTGPSMMGMFSPQ